jgi:hypothetical protein
LGRQSRQYTGRSPDGTKGTSHSFLQSEQVTFVISRGAPKSLGPLLGLKSAILIPLTVLLLLEFILIFPVYKMFPGSGLFFTGLKKICDQKIGNYIRLSRIWI